MNQTTPDRALSKRDFLRMVGAVAGASTMYGAMTSMGYAADSQFKGPLKLTGAPKGATVIVLGAGWAGLVSATELRRAGYNVQLVEYNKRIGGRAWTIRGGDSFTEMGGEVQNCHFDKGLYLNPGPWRIPYHHRAYFHYAKEFDIPLEPFIMVNYNAYVHSTDYFGGKPVRFREVQADYQGHIAELLSKCDTFGTLDQPMTAADHEMLRASLRDWGGLTKDYAYVAGRKSAERRGYEVNKGGGLMPDPVGGTPMPLEQILKSDVWRAITFGQTHQWQSSIFQPVGGMDVGPKAVGEHLKDVTTLNAKVTSIQQDAGGVTVTVVDSDTGTGARTLKADWCVCTLPTTVLNQIDIQVSPEMKAGFAALSYEAAVKTGLQFKRRFWEEDDHIYGGISFTDQKIHQIAYPNYGFNKGGKGVLLGTFASDVSAFELGSMSGADRVRAAVEQGTHVHPQYPAEFEHGVSVAWHRAPFVMGCGAVWSPELRAAHYRNLCKIDGRIVLAGDHLSNLVTWQEGAILSALDTVERLHIKIIAG